MTTYVMKDSLCGVSEHSAEIWPALTLALLVEGFIFQECMISLLVSRFALSVFHFIVWFAYHHRPSYTESLCQVCHTDLKL